MCVAGGGGLRSAIYRNLPQFYRNFSVMPLYKIFIFPQRKILSQPSLLLGTLYVYVFSSVLHVICVAGRFLFLCFFYVIHSCLSGNSEMWQRTGHAMPHRLCVCMVWGLALSSGSFHFANILTRTRGIQSATMPIVWLSWPIIMVMRKDGWISCLC